MAEGSNVLPVPKPGFFHLDLFVKDTKDVSPWYDELKARLDQETGPMESAMTNLLGVFAFYKLRGQGEARQLLEGLIQKDENNLNAIANIQFIYGHLMRAKDEMACRDRLQELLSEDSDAARVRNARCFAEQGYALAFDVRDDSKDMVSKIKSAIRLFETALSLVCTIDAMTVQECLVWKFYLSKCYWRLDQVIKHVQDKALFAQGDKLKGLIYAQTLLIEVTQLDPCWKHGRFYIARAWALLGSLESKFRRQSESYETPVYIIKGIPQTEESHIGCFIKAVKINPHIEDSEIYRRFGHMYLVHEHLYEKARQMLDKSIEIMPGSASNWVAYYIRSILNIKQYDELKKQSSSTGGSLPSKQLLKMAKTDAIASCDGAATPFNICQLGKVCHRLAIHPVTQVVEDWDELGDALDHFALALQLEDGFTNPEIQAARGQCLEVAKEHEKAAESYKRAVENDVDNTSYIWNLYGVLKNLLTLHGNGHGEHYIAEIAFWINEGFKKYADITPVLRNCAFKFGSQMIQVCQYLIDCDNSQLAEICLKCFRRHNNSACRKRAASIQSNLLKEDAPEASGIDGPSSEHSEQGTHVKVPVIVEKPRHGQEFKYDFFVSHSNKDADWVNYALLPALEVDMRFKGCVADRDFLPGKSVFDNIIHSIENSYKTLLILTPNFVTSEWCKYETEQALMESLKSKSGRVIPIMLHECDVPASVRTITYLDVSHDAIGSYDWLKLKKALEQIPSTKD
ncbi:TTC22 [Branchiostoma lanceolatum]|uniref:TTC22 protein n=1 Tax=Branchiostoma lanceolatum TaxID=7740 RepID=A0A8K0A2P5_BRALA|nr:TTC22 [Branchiostoma lanceolatum]